MGCRLAGSQVAGMQVAGKGVRSTLALPRPALQSVYGVLKEAEHRSTFYIPYWNLPLTQYLGGCGGSALELGGRGVHAC